MTVRSIRTHQNPTLVQRFLERVLSKRTRKLIFLSSLAGYMQNVTNPDNEMVEKINELFSLTRNPGAMKLPIQMNAKIWSAFDEAVLERARVKDCNLSGISETKVSIAQLRIVANQLIDTVPSWLIYGSREAMRQDIYKLLQAPLSSPTHHPVTS